MTALRTIVATCVLGVFVTGAMAQSSKTLREQLVGSWDYVLTEVTLPDGKKTLPYGEKPNGIVIFTEDGRFVQVAITAGIPKIASNNRQTRTAEENKAIVSGTIALYGTYTVDEDKKVVTFNVKASTYPNWDGAVQPRKIVALNASEFINENPSGSVGGGAVALNKYTRAR
jgi:Lipocalin-like domain